MTVSAAKMHAFGGMHRRLVTRRINVTGDAACRFSIGFFLGLPTKHRGSWILGGSGKLRGARGDEEQQEHRSARQEQDEALCPLFRAKQSSKRKCRTLRQF